jgi:hypothetical protein
MSHLVPCPECSRHVRVTEAECPFCALPLDLAGTPEPQLPRRRLGRAATFAFGATLVSASALAACSSDTDDSSGTGTGGTSSSAGAGGGAAGSIAGTTSVAGTTSIAGTGSAMPVYGAPAGFAGAPGTGTGGTGAGGGGQFPVYGAAP